MPITSLELADIYNYTEKLRNMQLVVRLYEEAILGVIRENNAGNKKCEIKTGFFTATDPYIIGLMEKLNDMYPDATITAKNASVMGSVIHVEW